MDEEAGPSGAGMKKKPMLDQVCEAIRVLSKPRKGASVVAIKKYILDASEESQHARIDTAIKKALAKGEEDGLLARPASCKNCVGASGSFILKPDKSKTKIVKPQNLPNDEMKSKKLYQPDDSEVVKLSKPTKELQKLSKPTKELQKLSKPTKELQKLSKPTKELQKLSKPSRTTKAKTSEEENEDSNQSSNIVRQSTPKKPEVELKGAKPRALIKKPAKSTKKKESDPVTTLKKHFSDSELTDVKKETVERKNLKETSKNIKNKKPGKSAPLKKTEKASHVKKGEKQTLKTLKSYSSDSVLL